MVRAWFIDEDKNNPREEHHRSPPKFIALEALYKITGVEYFQIDPQNFEINGTLRKLMDERGNKGIQLIENLDPDELKQHFTEHFHTYDEFRLALEGCGYFDVRDKFDEWIRIELLPGDLIVIPGGCYHRFTPDKTGYYKGVRVLKDGIYQAHIRPSDKLNCRKEYIHKLYNGGFDKEEEEETETSTQPSLISDKN